MSSRCVQLFVFCVAAIGLCSAADAYGVKPRIIDGTNVPASQFPTVGIVSNSANGVFCSGTLIAPRFVLTAAHCAVDGTTGEPMFGQSQGRFLLGGTTYSTARVYVNPTYHGDSSQMQEGAIDLCVFELDRDVPNVTPSPLNRQTPVVGTQMILVGYGEQGTGSTGINGTFPRAGTINYGYTNLDILTNTFTEFRFDNVPPPNQESDTAPGDSGGPQFIVVGGVNTVVSVTSGGTSAKSKFGDLSYNTRVDIAASWIDSLTGGPATTGDVPPVINSASYSPNPVLTGQVVTFSASASDANNDTLNYHWIFGDGTEDAHGTPVETHTFLVDGNYTVQLIVTDGHGGSVEQDIPIVVGDGGPINVIPALVVKKRFALNFAKPAKSALDFTLYNNTFVFRDSADYEAAFGSASVTIYIGSIQIDTLQMKGIRGTGGGGGTLTFAFRPGNVRYFTRGNPMLAEALAPYGAVNATLKRSITVPLRIQFNSDVFGGSASFNYVARTGKTGNGQ